MSLLVGSITACVWYRWSLLEYEHYALSACASAGAPFLRSRGNCAPRKRLLAAVGSGRCWARQHVRTGKQTRASADTRAEPTVFGKPCETAAQTQTEKTMRGTAGGVSKSASVGRSLKIFLLIWVRHHPCLRWIVLTTARDTTPATAVGHLGTNSRTTQQALCGLLTEKRRTASATGAVVEGLKKQHTTHAANVAGAYWNRWGLSPAEGGVHLRYGFAKS